MKKPGLARAAWLVAFSCITLWVAAKPAAADGRVILSPPPAPAPHINGPRVYGTRPGHPFLYRIPCTGRRPIQFDATGLPAGLVLDRDTGILSGVTPAMRGEYIVTLRASNTQGRDQRTLKVISGDTLALTPTMGYNHWYTHYDRVTQRLMEEAAERIVDTGMADAGYQYVNVDDCWMTAVAGGKYEGDPSRRGPARDANGKLLPNANFPDMKGLADYIHARGLKAGIYTSPGPRTCAGFVGAYGHEEQDAQQFAAWGYDFLKYDWCSYSEIAGPKPDLAVLQKPYRQMGELLERQPRDILFNLCQYGRGEVWKWGTEVKGQSWRTGGDLGFELERIFEVALRNCRLREFNRPGGWNDPDYLQIGWIGAQRKGGFEMPHPCPLTPNEQYSFMSLWCLMASPLFYSGDMSKLDEFTLRILCNPELIDIDQDPLGQCARVQGKSPDGFVLIKEIEDGGRAIGLCNTSHSARRMSIRWSDAGLAKPPARMRDCWRRVDLKEVGDGYEVEVAPRFVEVVRMYRD